MNAAVEYFRHIMEVVGKSDILWRKTDGTLKMWFMDGATKVAEGNPGALGTDWTIQDAAQFDRPRR